LNKVVTKCFIAFSLALMIFAASILPYARASPEQNVLRIAITCPPSTFNLLHSIRDVCLAGTFAYLLSEPLILHLVNGSVIPWVAKSWEILDNGTRYVFHIDERAKWSDGTPLTAYDVEFTWSLRMKYAFPSSLQGILSDVKAVDKYTVVFVTTQPWARWSLDFGGTLVLPKHVWENVEDPLKYEFIDDPKKHVTSGAFIYDSFKPGEWWYFRKRPDYWKTESMPKIDGVLLRNIADVSLFPLLLQKGDVDIADAYPFYLLPQVVGKPNIAIWFPPGPSATEVLCINTRLYPLNLKEVRQAIDLAIDKLEIAQFYFMGYGVPGNRCLVNMAAYPEFYVPEAAWLGWGKTKEERIAEARRILDELGIIDRDGDGVRETPNGTRLSFKFIIQMVPITAVRLRVSEAIIGYLKEIGIEISHYQPLEVIEYFIQAFISPQKDWGFAQGTYAEYPEPWYNQVFNYLLPSVGLSQVAATGWDQTDPEVAERVSELCHRALRRLNYADLVEDVKEIIRIYKDHLPTICLAFYPFWILAYRTDVLTNWNPEHSTMTPAFGFPQPSRPLITHELIPIGLKPPTAPPAEQPPTAPPTTPPTAPPPEMPPIAPVISIEQMIIIAIIVIIVIVAASYMAIKVKRKPKT